MPLELPNGTQLKNRLIKSAMSDMLGDGCGNPTQEQASLYARWADGGVAAAIVGEVQSDPCFPEAAGNLVLDKNADMDGFRALAEAGRRNNSALWLQLGHAGALTPAKLGDPAGPSALDLPELQARALSLEEIRSLPSQFAKTAARAETLGFGGVQIHAAHGFLLSQFLSPLFNRRTDAYGGSLQNRMRLLVETVEAVRATVSAGFTVALKLNSSDGLDGGLEEEDALQVLAALNKTGLDLIDISGGTYFPDAPASSDRSETGPYFLDFAAAARRETGIPLMATGGFKRREQATKAIQAGHIDLIGLARSLVLDPSLANTWMHDGSDPRFPRFDQTVPGGVTAWYTMAIRALSEGRLADPAMGVADAHQRLKERQTELDAAWQRRFHAATP